MSRYDVDGVHFDDYFYPYPVSGATFTDSAAFKKYGKGMNLAAWRRYNVDKLVAQVDKTVHETKKYVKFGISPFGIWRNKSDDPTRLHHRRACPPTTPSMPTPATGSARARSTT